MSCLTLRELLACHAIDAGTVRALRITLDPRDACADFRDLGDLIRANVVGTYERMQNGRRLGKDTPVLSFIAENDGRARLVGYKRFVSRRKGIAPGDIVYDYDAAHLFHSFIARARCPVFYDSFDIGGIDELMGSVVVDWPRPLMRNVVWADSKDLKLVSGAGIEPATT